MAEQQTEKKVVQVEYLVLRDCFGFPPIGGEDKKNRGDARRQDVPDSYYTRHWRKGERVTLNSDIKAPNHFHDTRKPTPEEVRQTKRHAINARKVRKITRSEIN